jgi:hypothetical protein
MLLLASLLMLRTVAQISVSHNQVSSAAAASVYEAPSPAELDRAVTLAANYLERACGPDGRFLYRIDVNSAQQSRSYNIVRHAGAIYALSMLQHSNPAEQKAVDAMLRAAFFLHQNYIGTGVRPGQLVVWSKPLPEISDADLGSTGLGLVALIAVNEARPNAVPLEQLKGLGRFVLFLQRRDGSFVSKFSATNGPEEELESLYYPGEAALGLIDLYETDRSPVWLNAAARALSYLARSRAGLTDVPPDHWAMIATAKLLPYYAQSGSPASRDELIQHAVQVCNALMKGQLRNSTNLSLDGAFDPAGRTAPVATRMEGLLAALEFLPNGSTRDRIKETVAPGIAFLLRAQISAGPYAGAMPQAVAFQSKGASDVRIDYVQHALCAWLRYKHLSNIAH